MFTVIQRLTGFKYFKCRTFKLLYAKGLINIDDIARGINGKNTNCCGGKGDVQTKKPGGAWIFSGTTHFVVIRLKNILFLLTITPYIHLTQLTLTNQFFTLG